MRSVFLLLVEPEYYTGKPALYRETGIIPGNRHYTGKPALYRERVLLLGVNANHLRKLLTSKQVYPIDFHIETLYTKFRLEMLKRYASFFFKSSLYKVRNGMPV